MSSYKIKLMHPKEEVRDYMQRLMDSNPSIIEDATKKALEDTSDLMLYGTKKTYLPEHHVDVKDATRSQGLRSE